jgi:hypothetical protein
LRLKPVFPDLLVKIRVILARFGDLVTVLEVKMGVEGILVGEVALTLLLLAKWTGKFAPDGLCPVLPISMVC